MSRLAAPISIRALALLPLLSACQPATTQPVAHEARQELVTTRASAEKASMGAATAGAGMRELQDRMGYDVRNLRQVEHFFDRERVIPFE